MNHKTILHTLHHTLTSHVIQDEAMCCAIRRFTLDFFQPS